MQARNRLRRQRRFDALDLLSASQPDGGYVILVTVFAVCSVGTLASAQSKPWVRHDVELRIGPDLRAVAVNAPDDAVVSISRLAPSPGMRAERSIPIGGFVPYIAIGLTD